MIANEIQQYQIQYKPREEFFLCMSTKIQIFLKIYLYRLIQIVKQNTEYRIYTCIYLYLNGIFPNINFFPKMPGGSMGHGFSYQLVMERCRQLSETDTKEKKRKTRRIPENINVNDDSSGKGYFSY